jgi:hypothetical protein
VIYGDELILDDQWTCHLLIEYGLLEMFDLQRIFPARNLHLVLPISPSWPCLITAGYLADVLFLSYSMTRVCQQSSFFFHQAEEITP